ncbi:MAG: hypothetical protein Q4C47_06495 [Planctomycetia bacterium]|nr:hypothetical protein [Planctomycetia bacterium]
MTAESLRSGVVHGRTGEIVVKNPDDRESVRVWRSPVNRHGKPRRMYCGSVVIVVEPAVAATQ